jgi:hypothetical protein
MRRILMVSVAAVVIACGPGRGGVVVDWTFEGVSCSQAGVATIHFAIAHEVLTPDQFSCAEAEAGVDLGTYLEGDYQLTISGFDALDALTHQTVVSLRVRGGRANTFAVDVPRVAPTTVAEANLTWDFQGNDCATADVDQVTILVDPNSDGSGGTDAGTVACSTMGTQGAFVSPLTPGLHSFAILGLRTVGNALHLVYRTHSPPTYLFRAGLVTDVFVSAEPTP